MISHPLRLTLTAAPAAEPVTVLEMRDHLRIDGSQDDTVLTTIIAAARELCENFTGRALITQSWSLFLDHWPGRDVLPWWDGVQEGADILSPVHELNLPKAPLQSVTAVNIFDAEDNATIWGSENYFVDTNSTPGRIVLRSGGNLPFPARTTNGIEIQFIAGYGDAASDVPQAIKDGIKLLAAHLYSNRGDVPTRAISASGAAALWQSARIVGLV